MEVTIWPAKLSHGMVGKAKTTYTLDCVRVFSPDGRPRHGYELERRSRKINLVVVSHQNINQREMIFNSKASD